MRAADEMLKSARQVQRFLPVHNQISKLFQLRRDMFPLASIVARGRVRSMYGQTSAGLLPQIERHMVMLSASRCHRPKTKKFTVQLR